MNLDLRSRFPTGRSQFKAGRTPTKSSLAAAAERDLEAKSFERIDTSKKSVVRRATFGDGHEKSNLLKEFKKKL